MPTIVYLVHGMGAGTADGSAKPAGDRWSDGVVAAMNFLTDSFKLARPTVLDPIPDTAPAGSGAANAVWLVPISYHADFDTFRAGATDRAKALSGLGIASLADANIAKLASNDFLWENCVDVLLWWADRAEAQTRVTANILAAITKADQLARTVQGATIRRILVTHSLGNATATWALRDLGTKPEWLAMGGFEYWFSLANVAPFLLRTEDVYSPPLLVGQNGSLVQRMHVVHHECDPIPWLIPWRNWSPSNAGKVFGPEWQLQESQRRLQRYETRGVVAPPGKTPDISNVHGFANYLLSTDVAPKLAAVIRGGAFTSQELTAIDYPTKWATLPALTCQKTATALADLKTEADKFHVELPIPTDISLQTSDGWFARLIRAVELVLAAKGAC